MKLISTYSVKIKNYNHIFKESVEQYRSAVRFFVDVVLAEWDDVSTIQGLKLQQSFVESLTVQTTKRSAVKYDFNKQFYKMPCYLRRAAIHEAIGKVASYKSNLENWETADKRTRGKAPALPKVGTVYPILYRDNMFIRLDDYTAQVKVYRNNTWDWLTVELRKSDVDYIIYHCGSMKELCPTLQKRGKCWYLDFSFEQIVTLSQTPVDDRKILAVDLGLNSSCVCSVMTKDGAVLERRFLKLPKEYDCLSHRIGHIKRAQRHGSRDVSNLWTYAKGVNDAIAVKTAQFIVDMALRNNVDCIVMEHLDLRSKKHGAHKQRLAMWRAQYVQQMVEHKAHMNGIRVSHVNAWGTSKLAYDGSGYVLRGKNAGFNSYSLCRFSNGKTYNCDLNATYNIGARYFIREILKSLPVTAGQYIGAKVPESMKRSTCTLSTLISLNGVLKAEALSCAV